MEDNEIDKLLIDENKQINKLHEIVSHTLKEEELIVHNLLNPPIETLTKGQKLSDKIAMFGGSWKFIISFFIILISWIIFNVIAIGHYRFDPYPFILMNLVLSCIAALQAPVIMMSQNRQEEKDRMRGENDYLIDLKAEMQIRSLHKKMDLLLEEQIKSICKLQSEQMEILKAMRSRLDYLESSNKPQ